MEDNKFSQIEKSILKTICWYDIFDYPLTAEEIWRWLYIDKEEKDFKKDLNDVLEVLEMSEKLKNIIEEDEGYYFLKGRREIVETRKERRDYDKKKWEKAKTAVNYLKMAPFVNYIAVCNNLALDNAKKESDIDFFIVTEPGHLFTARFFVTWLVHMLGLRRYKDKIKNKICLSFYLSSEALDFKPLLLQDKDPYFTFWVDQLTPLYDAANFHKKIQKENKWVKEFLPNAFLSENKKIIKKDSLTSLVKSVFETLFLIPNLGPWLNNFIRDGQRKKMEKNKNSVMYQDNNKVVISDSVLKFHENDRREEYRKRFYDKIKGLFE
ncbi:MAG: hypothetical protein U5L76_03835 [Patescibacteria group bacterium]|nr:hypothetical protein [Patescibacteria group bacterium]